MSTVGPVLADMKNLIETITYSLSPTIVLTEQIYETKIHN